MSTRRERNITLDALVQGKKITTEGADWFRLALDPFHDFNRPIAGYPDADGSHTVVSCFQHAYDLAKPAGATTWDAHIFTLPITCGGVMNVMNCTGATAQCQETAITADLGAINMITADPGESLFPDTPAWAPVNGAVANIGFGSTANVGNSRIIGWGLEVVNTTAEMYKQGACTVYCQPQAPTLCNNLEVRNAADNKVGETCSTRLQSPPSTVAEAVLLGGTQQWAAKDGCYLIVPQSRVENPIASQSLISYHFCRDAQVGAGDAVVHAPSTFSGTQTGATPLHSDLWGLSAKIVPFNTVGAFFTGLSAETTLRIKVKCYVERTPCFTDASLCVLASPSAPYDGRALSLYSAVAGRMPIGTMVSNNASGDWWRMVLSVIKKVAVPIGLTLEPFVPGAAPVAGAVVAGIDAVEKIDDSKSKPQPPRKPPKPRRARGSSAPSAKQ